MTQCCGAGPFEGGCGFGSTQKGKNIFLQQPFFSVSPLAILNKYKFLCEKIVVGQLSETDNKKKYFMCHFCMYVEDEPTELDRFRNTAYIMGTGQVKTIKNKENPPFCINLDKNIIQTFF